jgi:hypothetical protein
MLAAAVIFLNAATPLVKAFRRGADRRCRSGGNFLSRGGLFFKALAGRP